MYEIDLAGAELHDIRHPFGFVVNGSQAFYVMGAAYY